MFKEIKIDGDTITKLRCPECHSKLIQKNNLFECTNSFCNATYPIVIDIPIILSDKKSIFSVSDFTGLKETFFKLDKKGSFRQRIREFLPDISVNTKANSNFKKFGTLLAQRTGQKKVLVIGGGILGHGMEELLKFDSITLIESDVSHGPRTQIIFDGHDIPFQDEAFDGVIVQAVLEHVVDPTRCVEEIHRILKPSGVILSDTPFMQQVHGGRYDFTRFTHLGHRRLFRKFDEVESGVSCGPGMGLAWSIQYFFLSFTGNLQLRRIIKLIAKCTLFFLKYFDKILINRKGGYDAASGVYFIGKKSDNILSDRDLIKQYIGHT